MVIELDLEDRVKLADLAQSTRRTEVEVVSEAMHHFLSAQKESYAEAVAAGDRDFVNGDFLDHDAAVISFADVLRHP